MTIELTAKESLKTISVVVPLHNEAEVIPALLERALAVLDDLPGGPHELILVNDGSTDATEQLIEEAAQNDGRCVGVTLSRNFGQQAAFCAGLNLTKGDAVVLMDGDLQDPPEVIPQLLEKMLEGYDVVFAIRTHRKEGIFLRFCYWLFYFLITWLSKTKLPRDAGDFSIVSRRVADHLMKASEQQHYLRGLRAWVGFKQVGIPIERGERVEGESKYSMRSLIGLAMQGIFAHSLVPLRLATIIGAGAIAVSFFVTLHSLYTKWIGDSPQGFTSTIIAIIFFGGVQLFFLGVIGEYVGRIYEEVKGRPTFIVDKVTRKRDDGD